MCVCVRDAECLLTHRIVSGPRRGFRFGHFNGAETKISSAGRKFWAAVRTFHALPNVRLKLAHPLEKNWPLLSSEKVNKLSERVPVDSWGIRAKAQGGWEIIGTLSILCTLIVLHRYTLILCAVLVVVTKTIICY